MNNASWTKIHFDPRLLSDILTILGIDYMGVQSIFGLFLQLY